MAKRKRNPNNKNGAAVLILVLVLIFIFGIVSYGVVPALNGTLSGRSNTSEINVPTVTSTMRSVDGEYHTVQTRFTLSLDKKTASDISTSYLHDQIAEIMAALEFEKMNGEGSMEYVKEKVGEGLEQYIDAESIQGIYITAMQCDGEPFDETGNTQRDRIFRGLFN